MSATISSVSTMMRTASTEHVDIRHPTPDLIILPEGAIHHNVLRLEQSAEELSQGGSDIGDEIRKLQEEQRRSDSRRSSLNSTTNNIHNTQSSSQNPLTTARSRGASASSYANSIVDLNREARWGGYSPGAFIGSPAQSIHSGSWSQPVLHRTASNTLSISTRPEPVQEGRPLDSPLASPTVAVRQASHSSLSRSISIQNSWQPSRRGSRSSKRDSVGSAESAAGISRMHRTSDEFEDHREASNPQESEMTDQQRPEEAAWDNQQNMPHPESVQQVEQEQERYGNNERPGSSDTFRQANILFQDFDGVHFSPTREEFIELDEHGNEIRSIPLDQAAQTLLYQQDQAAQALLRRQQELATPRQVTFAHPPPPDRMVYYPAPVPRMLNLPKKLSSKPAPSAVVQRTSQIVLQSPPKTVRKGVQIGEFNFERQQRQAEPPTDQVGAEGGQQSATPSIPASPAQHPDSPQKSPLPTRQSTARMAHIPLNLPPQLRASLFFDAPAAAPQYVDIKSDSAVATLDSILDASATAPVSVFTDHPFAGRIGGQVYARERQPRVKRNTLANPLVADAKSNSNGLDDTMPGTTRRRSITGRLTGSKRLDPEFGLPRRHSVMNLFTEFGNSDGKKLQKRSSRMSLNSENMLGDDAVPRPASPARSAPLERTDYQREFDNEPELDEAEYEDEAMDEADMGPVYAQPTTLLAELQLRKAQQKTRTRTAATAYPNGMHSTLLQLDAVAQVEAKKRKAHKVALAWEDPSLQPKENEEIDDDVPLAVLFPTKNGLHSKRPGEGPPVGLLEKRRLEDNEPLSSRRNRILGINPRAANRMTNSALNLASPSTNHLSAPGSSRGEPSPAYAHSINPQENEDDLTLAERRRRIQQKAMLDSALGDVVAKDNKSTFEADMMSVLVPHTEPDVAPKVEDSKPSSTHEVEETLGQRRARLQREALQNGQGQAETRAPLRQSMSLANLLAAAPLDSSKERAGIPAGRYASNPAPGTLLSNHDVASRAQKAELLARNARVSSYTDRQSTVPRRMLPSASMPNGFAQQQHMQAHLPTQSYLPGGFYSQTQMAQQQMMNPLAFQNFMPPAPATGVGFQGGMAAYDAQYGMNGMAMMGQMQMQNPMMMGGMGGYPAGNPMVGNPMMANPMAGAYNNMAYYPGMAMGYNDPLLGMDPAQRDKIDRWRSGVAQ